MRMVQIFILRQARKDTWDMSLRTLYSKNRVEFIITLQGRR